MVGSQCQSDTAQSGGKQHLLQAGREAQLREDGLEEEEMVVVVVVRVVRQERVEW